LPDNVQIEYLIRHHVRHELEGNCQLRTFTDIKLLDPENKIESADNFLNEPKQGYKYHFRRECFRLSIKDIHPKNRFRFIAGELFPSIKWMKKRYKCSGAKALLYYSHRVGKLLWLI
jgi:hypothetical protein